MLVWVSRCKISIYYFFLSGENKMVLGVSHKSFYIESFWWYFFLCYLLLCIIKLLLCHSLVRSEQYSTNITMNIFILPLNYHPCGEHCIIHEIISAPKYLCITKGNLMPSCVWLFSNKLAIMRGSASELPFKLCASCVLPSTSL